MQSFHILMEKNIIELRLNINWSLFRLFSETNLFPKAICLFLILRDDK